VAERPDLAALLESALALHADGDLESAEALYTEILGREPQHFTARHCLGVIASQRGRYEDAARMIGEALQLNPRSAMAHLNLGIALGQLGRPAEAISHYRLSLALNPDFPDTHMNLAVALHALQRHEQALAAYDRALELKPDFALAHSNKIFTLDFIPRFGFAEHQQERRAFQRMQAARFHPPAHPNPRDPDRPLTVGYVSADFRRHSAASCFGPVLHHHDRDAFRVVCYSGVRVEDDWTGRFRSCASAWRAVAGLDDEALADLIRQDGVDILVDLSGHTEGNRLLVFARKPAPVQVTAWGHGGGTGLPAIDHQFTDPVHTPAWARPLFAESSWDLPCCITFEHPSQAPPVAGLPVLASGFVTFGSINRVIKLTPEARALWARILQAVPGSRLLLKDASFDDPRGREAVLDAFSGLGIGPERLELLGFTSHEEHLAACARIDLALDTFPQNGGITTWETLWMGVPVVAVAGNKPPSRISAAILHALGLDGWIAEDEEGYLRLAVAAAADSASLARFRQDIRPRIAASAAGDPERYTRTVEAAYRAMWRGWVDRANP